MFLCLNTYFWFFWSENCALSVDIVGLLLFSLSKKEYLTVQKKNFFKVEELDRESTCSKNAHFPFLEHMDNEGKGRFCCIRKICEYHSVWCKGCYQSDKQE